MSCAARAVCFALLVSAGSCRSLDRPPAKEQEQRQRERVTHVVLCWLKTPGDEAARRRVIEASHTFITMPGVVSVTAGTALLSTRPAVDPSFDVGVVMTFTDEAALRAYDAHPHHKRAVEEVLKPLVGKLVIYDFAAREMKTPAR